MRTIAQATSLLSYWESLVYTIAALEASPATASFVGPVKAHLEAQAPLVSQDQAARLARAVLSAKIALYLGEATEALTDLYGELKLVLRDRKHELITYCFKDGLKGAVRLPLERQVESCRLVHEHLSAPGFPEAILAKYQARLLALVTLGDELVSQRQTQERAYERLKLDLTRWRDEANRLRLQTFGDLTRLGSTLHKDRTFAERFFPGTPRRAKSADVEPS